MNIHTNQQSIRGWGSVALRATGLAKACIAFALCVSLSGQLQGQSAWAAGRTVPAASKIGSTFAHGDQAYRVVSVADYASNTDVSQVAADTVAQAGCFLSGGQCGSDCDAACTSCDGFGGSMDFGGGSYGESFSSCSSCGGYGSAGGGYFGGSSCPTCSASWYGSLEALYMRKDGSRRFSVSPDFFISALQYEWAPRLTIGHVPDCVHGYEFSFTGAFEWDREGVQVDPAGGIGTLLFAVPPVDPAGLSAFSNATAKAQYYKTQYWSIEMSNTNVGWDIMKLVCGFRYINYDENFTVISQNVANEVGLLRSDIKNQMLGYQLGLDLLYPVCHNTYTDFRARAGFYANFIDLNFQVLNAGSTTVLMLDDAIDIAGQFEFGSGIRYQCNDGLSFRTGFELWYLTGLATAKNQFSNGIVASQTVRASDDFFVAGLSFGAEYRY